MKIAPGPKPPWWQTVFEHAQSAAADYGRAPGLVEFTSRAVPLPEKHKCKVCTGSNPNAIRVRDKRPTRKRPHDIVPLTGKRPRPSPFACLGGQATGHGSHVDAAIGQYVASGGVIAAMDSTDPCAINVGVVLARYKWVPVAAQVPLRCPRLGTVVTAIDLLCTDAATHTDLILVEIKATRRRRNAHLCYVYEENGGPVFNGTIPRTAYAHHQLQLLAMHDALQHYVHEVPTRSVVLRTGPTLTDCYDLHPDLLRRSATILDDVLKTRPMPTPHRLPRSAFEPASIDSADQSDQSTRSNDD